MTIASTVTKKIYDADGVTRDWPITMETSGISSSEIKVYLVDEDGVSTLVTANYDVDLTALSVEYPTVVSGLDPIASPNKILLVRELALTQPTDYKNQGDVPAETIEEGLDRLTEVAQQLQEQVDRSVKSDISENSGLDYEDFVAVKADCDAAQAAAEVAQGLAEDAQASAEAVLTDAGFVAVAADLIGDDNIGTVADSISDVNDVADNVIAIAAVNANETNINAVNSNKTNIDAVAANATNINAVNTNKTNIDAVAGNATNINAVATNAANINTVAGDTADINTVADNIADVNTVADNIATIASKVSGDGTVNPTNLISNGNFKAWSAGRIYTANFYAGFNGSDGATTYTSETGQVATFYGTAQLDTAQKKFGTASLLLDGNSDYLTFPARTAIGTGSFTVAFWARFNSNGGNQTFLQLGNSYSSTAGFVINKLAGGITFFPGAIQIASGSVPENNTWFHVAVVGNGGADGSRNIKMYVDGTQVGSTYTVNYNYTETAFYVGCLDISTDYLNGWIDDVVVINGTQLWTSNFTVPTSNYTDSWNAPDGFVIEGTTPAIARDTGDVGYGSYSSKITASGAGSQGLKYTLSGLKASTTYSVSWRTKVTSGDTSQVITTGAGTNLSATESTSTTFETKTGTFITDASGTAVVLKIMAKADGDIVWFDGIQVNEGSSAFAFADKPAATLDGTWTPAISFGGGTTGITYVIQAGYWSKIGSLVFFSGTMGLSNKGSSTGAALITGLPFTVANNSGAYACISFGYCIVRFANQLVGRTTINATTIDLYGITEAAGANTLRDTDFTNSSYLQFSGFYRAA